MTEKHKLKKRARARKQAEGTTYSAALEKEREAKPLTTPQWTLANLRELHGVDRARDILVDFVFEEQQKLRGCTDNPRVESFIDRVCGFAIEINTTSTPQFVPEFDLIPLMEAAVGIDRFWTWDPYGDTAQERWALWTDARDLLKNDAGVEALRERIAVGVRSGLEAPERPQEEPHSVELQEGKLKGLWESDIEVMRFFGCFPQTPAFGRQLDDEVVDQESKIIVSLMRPCRFRFEATDTGISFAAADAQVSPPGLHRNSRACATLRETGRTGEAIHGSSH